MLQAKRHVAAVKLKLLLLYLVIVLAGLQLSFIVEKCLFCLLGAYDIARIVYIIVSVFHVSWGRVLHIKY
ncbi:hypothetical protein P3575_24130, partial [Vibrio parahaemolyticus]|nr:hypothetical protein [Vibrio parahaemolyticus]